MTELTGGKLVAKNTAMLYIRMFFIMIVTLYTSRVVLDVLGDEDFGLFGVVGGVVAMLAVLNASMSISVQRFLSFEIGKGSALQVQKVFILSLFTHIIIAVIVFILAEAIGPWFIRSYLDIPAARMEAAITTYHFTVLSALVAIIQVPYNAMIISKEKMTVFAYVGILEVILRLLIVYLLFIGNFDKLVLYGALTFAVSLIIMLVIITYCSNKFSDTHPRFIWDKNLFKQLLSFANWTIMGEIAWIFTLQGVNILLNIFYGLLVNAARTLSYLVQSAINRFVSNFQTALIPQMIKNYATDNFNTTSKLLFRGSCLSYYLLLLLSLPVFIETEQILHLWLKEVPEYTVIFCRLVIINSLIDALSGLLPTIVRAYGRIKKYQTVVSLVLFLNFPLSYFALKAGSPSQSVFYIYGIVSFALLIIRLVYVKKMMPGFSARQYMKEVPVTVFIITILSSFIPILYRLTTSESILRLIVSVLISVFSVLFFVYFLGLKKEERKLATDYIKKFIHHDK